MIIDSVKDMKCHVLEAFTKTANQFHLELNFNNFQKNKIKKVLS